MRALVHRESAVARAVGIQIQDALYAEQLVEARGTLVNVRPGLAVRVLHGGRQVDTVEGREEGVCVPEGSEELGDGRFSTSSPPNQEGKQETVRVMTSFLSFSVLVEFVQRAYVLASHTNFSCATA